MLKDRILSTLRFFDLLDNPVTLLELHRFLLVEEVGLRQMVGPQGELVGPGHNAIRVDIGQVIRCLNEECHGEIEEKSGFYCLKGRMQIIDNRLANYLYGVNRERRIRRYAKGLRFVPFIRGAALAGSQAMGVQKKDSDIDLLIIVDPKFLWLARTLATAYFQIFFIRRHGRMVANRFCLNHYLAGVKQITELRNLYTAWEYGKLRPLVYGGVIKDYQEKNASWITAFFPNFEPLRSSDQGRSSFQKRLEQLLSGSFGQWCEQKLKTWQLSRIRQEEFILVREDELSFHPQSKQRELLERFFSVPRA